VRRSWPIGTLLVALLVVATAARVAATHHVFSPTYDEPAHIFGGYEWYADGRYTFDPSHPPLARLVFAFPFRNVEYRTHDVRDRVGHVLETSGSYMRGVILARRGNLLFLAIALIALTVWAAQLYGMRIAIMAAALFALLPPVLAHAGLATTDIPVTTAIAAATAVLIRWLDTPTWKWTAALAIAFGLGLLTKFSFPIYFAITAVAIMTAARRWPVAKGLAAIAGAVPLLWIAYFFNRLPRFFKGFMIVMRHNAEGHAAYFRGEVSETGWWEYFPVVFGIKTPIPFLALAVIGAFFILRERRHRALVAIAAAMMCVAMTSRINLGVRHVLPIYLPLSIAAAVAVDRLWRSRAKLIAPALALWLVINSVAAHPDYLPWMNAFAGTHPERVVLDSNFDWGQDVLRLRDACRRQRIERIGVELFGTTDYGRIGMPPTHPIPRYERAAGWFAVNESFIIPEQVRDASAFRWLTTGCSVQRVGKTVRLYRCL
jgi:hypothetical protein